MDDILRRLYSGECFPQENTGSKNKKFKKENEIMENSHQKIMVALTEKYGDEIAFQIDNDFMSSYASIINEEMFNIFKEGFHLGFDIVIASINHRD